MTQKKILVAVIAVGMMFLLTFVVYQQFVPMRSNTSDNFIPEKAVKPMKPQAAAPVDGATAQAQASVPIPTTVDDIAADIQKETTLDTAALDKEQAGETSALQQDSNSVNNLGTTYDSNNL